MARHLRTLLLGGISALLLAGCGAPNTTAPVAAIQRLQTGQAFNPMTTPLMQQASAGAMMGSMGAAGQMPMDHMMGNMASNSEAEKLCNRHHTKP